MTGTAPPAARPLDGLRVLELGQVLAGPFAGALLAHFGAEVVKVEPPGAGDPIRGWRLLDRDTSLWWYSLARNKKCVTLDLRQPEGQRLARRLAVGSDVLIENFRPGTMERWGLGPEALAAEAPGLIYARVSGFGQSGPDAARPGYASVCEAEAGLRHLTGQPGEVPVRANLSLGDTLAGLHAVVGILLALVARGRPAEGRGQVVDVSILESVFACLESTLPEYDRLGVVRGPSGATITGVVPSNTYPTRDGLQLVIGANSDSNFRRLMDAIGRADLAADPALSSNAGRVTRQAELDGAIAAWTAARDAGTVLDALAAAEVPCGRIRTVADLAADPHLAARGMLERVATPGGPLLVPGFAPRLERTPGRTEWAGPALGAHNAEIFGGRLGLDDPELGRLAARGVI